MVAVVAHSFRIMFRCLMWAFSDYPLATTFLIFFLIIFNNFLLFFRKLFLIFFAEQDTDLGALIEVFVGGVTQLGVVMYGRVADWDVLLILLSIFKRQLFILFCIEQLRLDLSFLPTFLYQQISLLDHSWNNWVYVRKYGFLLTILIIGGCVY